MNATKPPYTVFVFYTIKIISRVNNAPDKKGWQGYLGYIVLPYFPTTYAVTHH